MSSVVSFEEHEKYSLISLDDGKANAVSVQLVSELNNALDQAEQAGKVLLLTGRSGKFSAGFDLSVMGQGGQAVAALVASGALLAKRMLSFNTPIVIAANGHALAMGAFFLLSADYRIGTLGKYKLGLNEVAIGMTMPYFGVEIAKAKLASVHVNRSLLNAEIYGPEAAIEAGFLDEAVAQDELMSTAIAYAEQLSGLNMAAHHATKLRSRGELLDKIEAAIKREFKQ